MKTDNLTQVETPPPAPSPETASAAVTPPVPSHRNGQPKPTKRKPATNGPARAGAFTTKAEPRETPERVTQTGAIRIANEDALRAVPLFYYGERGHWFSTDGRGSFGKIPDSQAKSYLAEYGFNKVVADAQGNTPAERAVIWLTQNKRVAFAGALAGYPAGVHESGGIRFLVTESPALISRSFGDHSG